MMRNSLTCIASLAILALAAGCASSNSGRTNAATTADCRQLGAEIAETEKARRAALQKERDAWKVVVPFAVVARYADGRKASAEAERKLAMLRAEANRQGCGSHGS